MAVQCASYSELYGGDRNARFSTLLHQFQLSNGLWNTGSVGVVDNATYGDATIWDTPEGSLWATVTATLAGIKDAIGTFDDFGHTLILRGSALSALGLAFPGITLPVSEMQVEMLTVGHAIAGPIPDTYGVDPPLPLISPGGMISPEVANAINGWNASEQSLISLIRNMRTQVTNAQYAISQGDAPTATTLENELKAELSTLASSLRSQAIQLAARKSELISSGVPDFSGTLAQITEPRPASKKMAFLPKRSRSSTTWD